MIEDCYLMPTQMLEKFASTLADTVYLRQPVNREFQEITWAEAYDKTLRLAAGLRSLGLERGDKVSILSENCAEWFLADFAITAAGLISVPIYFTAGEKTISYVLEHSGAKAIVVGKLGNFSAAKAAIPGDVITIGTQHKSLPTQHYLEQLIADHSPIQDVAMPDIDDVFSIVYTSGSTGQPKGVVLTFRNIIFGGTALSRMFDRPRRERLFSYLPLAHITERAVIEYTSLYNGSTVTFNESLATFTDDLKSANVTSFISVPRLWMKFQAGVLAKCPQAKLDKLLANPLTAWLIKRKIRSQLGLKYSTFFGSGSAPIATAVLDWYHKLGIDISEAWGMTETSAGVTINYPFRADKIGSIGQAVEGVDVKVSDEGEILVRGDAVFKEYYKKPEVTNETFDGDWLRTGDRAAMDNEGYFRITGRVKELFKTQKGKYVAPVPIESLLLQNQLIDQICVMGSGMANAMAVVALSPETSKGLVNDQITESLAATLAKVNEKLEAHEYVGSICVVKESWNVANGLLTPTLKIKRDLLEAKYQLLISLETKEPVIWE